LLIRNARLLRRTDDAATIAGNSRSAKWLRFGSKSFAPLTKRTAGEAPLHAT
jgi:hypothetical protein